MSDTVPSSTIRNGTEFKEQHEDGFRTAECHPPSARVIDDFFNMTPISFQVENTVFRVNKHGFDIPGTIFEAMFSLPTSSGNEEGSSNDNPIHLDGIRADHFRAFLRVLYPFRGRAPVTEFEDWLGVLILSTMWRFTEIRGEAIAALTEQIRGKSALESIHLGRKYELVDWIRDAYIELLQRDTLTIEELLEGPFPLDWITIAKIYSIRDSNYVRLRRSEVIYHSACGNEHSIERCPHGRKIPPQTSKYKMDLGTASDAVTKVFREELEDMPKF